jgi:hypothetical protein
LSGGLGRSCSNLYCSPVAQARYDVQHPQPCLQASRPLPIAAPMEWGQKPRCETTMEGWTRWPLLGPQQGPGIFGTMLVSEPNGGYGTYFGPGRLVISARSRESHHSETSCRMHAFAYLEYL